MHQHQSSGLQRIGRPGGSDPAKIDLVGLFVPQNVFNALVDDTVPAVVLSCIAIGVALIGIKEKGQALGLFATISEALTRVTKGLTRMAPIGIFAIAASAAGTMTLAELGRLQGYFIAYIIAFALLTFLVLPGLVAAVTPFKYRVGRAGSSPG